MKNHLTPLALLYTARERVYKRWDKRMKNHLTPLALLYTNRDAEALLQRLAQQEQNDLNKEDSFS
ncbi:hypothetical protein KSF_088260 [Reticulibacter mediterranei]|uniref:Uncharacterized protein n=1 Tax=Reticulibacter mediterranei TaxID=2778369 RepID=A0A8J3IR74_9CHLR|nr:hypothetical protein [Reticulibacter mediterranei]GHO98778.1 hypothetical protein KSF_088260 [Reticulibacter mediterranei]